jgi:hypothetical protein
MGQAAKYGSSTVFGSLRLSYRRLISAECAGRNRPGSISERGSGCGKGDTMTGHIHDIPQVVGRPAGYVNDATGTQHVVYRGDADFNVINDVRWDGTGLHYTNLNLAAGGTPAGVATGRGDPAAYVFPTQGTEHVVYRGFDNHVHELWKDASGWHHSDLTAVTGAPTAESLPGGTPNGGRTPRATPRHRPRPRRPGRWLHRSRSSVSMVRAELTPPAASVRAGRAGQHPSPSEAPGPAVRHRRPAGSCT